MDGSWLIITEVIPGQLLVDGQQLGNDNGGDTWMVNNGWMEAG